MKALFEYSIEELNAELERRTNEEIEIRDKYERENPNYSSWPLAHRSCGWKAMYNHEPKKQQINWIEKWLIPRINEVTGIQWVRESYFIRSAPNVTITLPHGDYSVIEHNEVAKAIKKKFPTLSEECFGYKLEKVKDHKEENGVEIYSYEGMWALSIENIRNRGRIQSEKYGL